MKDGRKILLKYSITVGCALFAAALILYRYEFFNAEAVAPAYKMVVEQYKMLALTNAFTVPGILLILVGSLLWVSTFGFFDGIGYAVGQVKSMFIPTFKKAKHENYYDYKKKKGDKRISGYSFVFFVGLAFFAVGIVFWLLDRSYT